MLHVYRWQVFTARVGVLIVVCILAGVGLYHKRHSDVLMIRKDLSCPQLTTRNNPAINWEQVFSFVPLGLKSCTDLFSQKDKDEPFSEEYVQRRMIYKDRLKTSFKQTDKRMGHTGKFIEESLVMKHLVTQTFVRTVCETGFNAGHGTFLWLQSNPNVTVFSFDDAVYPYAKPLAKFLQKMFPGRLGVTWGDSRKTLPEFHVTHPEVTCDVILIDGGHIYDVAKADYENFRKMASGTSVILYDNYPQTSMNHELGRVWEGAKQRGEISEVLSCDYEPVKEQGFSVGIIQK